MGEDSVLGDTHPAAPLQGLPKSIFSHKWHPKLKTENFRRYVVCWKAGKKQTSLYFCQICYVGFCLQDCFELYHTEIRNFM